MCCARLVPQWVSPALRCVAVQAVDDGRPSKAGSGTYTVNVIDVNEAPSFLSTVPISMSVSENVASGTVLGTFAATDPDAADVGKLR